MPWQEGIQDVKDALANENQTCSLEDRKFAWKHGVDEEKDEDDDDVKEREGQSLLPFLYFVEMCVVYKN